MGVVVSLYFLNSERVVTLRTWQEVDDGVGLQSRFQMKEIEQTLYHPQTRTENRHQRQISRVDALRFILYTQGGLVLIRHKGMLALSLGGFLVQSLFHFLRTAYLPRRR